MIAVALELAGVSALPFAVGMYLPLSATTPIFVGGMLRWLADRLRGRSASEAETETSPGVLLSSGYIAGGTLCGLVIAFFVFLPDSFNQTLDLSRFLGDGIRAKGAAEPKRVALLMFLDSGGRVVVGRSAQGARGGRCGRDIESLFRLAATRSGARSRSAARRG